MAARDPYRGINTRERIISLIEDNEDSYKEFERKFDLKPGTVSEWKRGRMFNYLDYLVEIADEYQTTTDWLLGRVDDDTPDFKYVFIIGSIRAGYPVESFENNFDYVKIPTEVSPNGQLYALKVIGDSMMPIVIDGDTIILDKNKDKVNGKICAVTIDNESTLKRVKMDSTGITLIPTNPMYPEMHYSKRIAEEKGFHIDGVLVQMIRNF